jgi:hypothetical protein
MFADCNESYVEVTDLYFEEFDYELNLEFKFSTPQYKSDSVSIYDEEDVAFNVVHNDVANNACLKKAIQKNLLKFPDASTKTYSMNEGGPVDKYKTSTIIDTSKNQLFRG